VPRALIGYLVGYQVQNIYQIWDPGKVSVTQDIFIDETKEFNPYAPYLGDLLLNAVPLRPETVDLGKEEKILHRRRCYIIDKDEDKVEELDNSYGRSLMWWIFKL
jgi:hypothetical protein